MNCLRDLEGDRLPFVKVCGAPWPYSDVQRWHELGLPLGSEPRTPFGFDCAEVTAKQGTNELLISLAGRLLPSDDEKAPPSARIKGIELFIEYNTRKAN